MSTNDTDWSLMYEALLVGLRLNANSFQLIYPFTSWSWPTAEDGSTSAVQIDFCAAMPQWSAVGRYISSGSRFDDAYGNFLCVLIAAADADLEQQISDQQTVVQEARNSYEIVYAEAEEAYAAATDGSNIPTFTEWLASGDTERWQTKLDRLYAEYEAQVEILEELILQTGDAELTSAIKAYSDPAFYTRYEDVNLSNQPAVPAYTVASSSEQWLEQVKEGRAESARIDFTRGRPAYDYRQTWAGGSRSVDEAFLAVEVEGTWRSVPAGGNTDESITIDLPAWAKIGIGLEGWYEPTFPVERQAGPFIAGYSGYPSADDVHMWGEGGVMSLVKRALLVAYQPTVTLSGSEASVDRWATYAESASAMRIGPFVFDDSAGGQISAVADNGRLTLTSASSVPVIFGLEVGIMPSG